LEPVSFDADHLHQILSNLLSNAARFASGKPNSIAVHLRKRTKGLAIVVLADGIRVDSQVKTHLFEPFQSASKQGTGLGLFLCREYARANRGGLRLVEPLPDAADNDPAHTWVPKPYTKAFVLAVPWAKPTLH
jgi:two-component system, NtrC family, sensor histidine kinase PilS